MGKRQMRLLLSATLLILVQLACAQVGRAECASKNGVWLAIKNADGTYEFVCAFPPTQTGVPPDSSTPSNAILTAAPGQEASPTQRTSQADSNACNATQYLGITSDFTRQETNQYGTRLCEYSLTIRNTNEEVGVWVYFYQHDKDGYAHTEKSHWMGNILTGPGADGNWSGSVYLYTDQDADGPVMSVPERLAGVYDIPECAGQKRDENFFEQISVPVDSVCPME
jgi:hypothetical protein